VAPAGEGAQRCIALAMQGLNKVDYINAHGTSTPLGDIIELEAIRSVFNSEIPPISSTKSLSGHSLGAAGVHEAIYSLLMLQHNFIAGTTNIEELDPRAEGMNIVRESRDQQLQSVLSNSYGFGGTNGCLVFEKI
jgi:3-oxoacyl-[acyl-carrier-protein] synthase-1